MLILISEQETEIRPWKRFTGLAEGQITEHSWNLKSKGSKTESGFYFVLSSFPASVNFHCKPYLPERNHKGKKTRKEMEKHNTTEMVKDKESGCLILGREADKKVTKMDTFLV